MDDLFWLSDGQLRRLEPFFPLIGGLTLGTMQNGLTLLNVPCFCQCVAIGTVVILAVLADRVRRRRS